MFVGWVRNWKLSRCCGAANGGATYRAWRYSNAALTTIWSDLRFLLSPRFRNQLSLYYTLPTDLATRMKMVVSSTKRVHSLDHELQPTPFSAIDVMATSLHGPAVSPSRHEAVSNVQHLPMDILHVSLPRWHQLLPILKSVNQRAGIHVGATTEPKHVDKSCFAHENMSSYVQIPSFHLTLLTTASRATGPTIAEAHRY
jgi:hypothetical protein